MPDTKKRNEHPTGHSHCTILLSKPVGRCGARDCLMFNATGHAFCHYHLKKISRKRSKQHDHQHPSTSNSSNQPLQHEMSEEVIDDDHSDVPDHSDHQNGPSFENEESHQQTSSSHSHDHSAQVYSDRQRDFIRKAPPHVVSYFRLLLADKLQNIKMTMHNGITLVSLPHLSSNERALQVKFSEMSYATLVLFDLFTLF